MLSILVLFCVTSAFAAPQTVNLRQVSENEVGFRDNSFLGPIFNLIDGGDTPTNVLNIEEVLRDLSRNPRSQAQAAGQAIALVGELAPGRPGDACAAAYLINAYARYVTSGNPAGVRDALRSYVQSLAGSIDTIVRLVSNPESVRFAIGPRGGCAGEGRAYPFDVAWDSILGSASPNQISVINEEFCTAKRLYCAQSARSNNVGAQITASALPPTTQVFQAASGALGNLVKTLGSGGNVGQAAGAAKQALLSAVFRVNL